MIDITDNLNRPLSLYFAPFPEGSPSVVFLISFIPTTAVSVKQYQQESAIDRDIQRQTDRQADRRTDRTLFNSPTSASDTPFDDIYLINGND